MRQSVAAGVLGGWLMAVLSAFAAMKENPYQTIAMRNPFGLHEAVVEAPKPPAEPPLPRPEVKITVVTTMLGAPKAAFQYEDAQTKKVEYSPLLGEGGNYKTFTVMFIDPENSTVRINQEGREATLDFVHNGVKPDPRAPSPAPPARTVSLNPAPPPPALTNRVMSREEAQQAIEEWQKRRAEELNGQGQPGPPPSFVLPPTGPGPQMSEPSRTFRRR